MIATPSQNKILRSMVKGERYSPAYLSKMTGIKDAQKLMSRMAKSGRIKRESVYGRKPKYYK